MIKIFAGEGSDIIHPGPGKDLIDLSEDIAFKGFSCNRKQE